MNFDFKTYYLLWAAVSTILVSTYISHHFLKKIIHNTFIKWIISIPIAYVSLVSIGLFLLWNPFGIRPSPIPWGDEYLDFAMNLQMMLISFSGIIILMSSCRKNEHRKVSGVAEKGTEK